MVDYHHILNFIVDNFLPIKIAPMQSCKAVFQFDNKSVKDINITKYIEKIILNLLYLLFLLILKPRCRLFIAIYV